MIFQNICIREFENISSQRAHCNVWARLWFTVKRSELIDSRCTHIYTSRRNYNLTFTNIFHATKSSIFQNQSTSNTCSHKTVGDDANLHIQICSHGLLHQARFVETCSAVGTHELRFVSTTPEAPDATWARWAQQGKNKEILNHFNWN